VGFVLGVIPTVEQATASILVTQPKLSKQWQSFFIFSRSCYWYSVASVVCRLWRYVLWL